MQNPEISINSKDSLVHLGSLDSFDITPGGKRAGRLILRYLKNGDKKALSTAIKVYERLIPNENFGGEYTALEWLCRLWLSPKEAQDDLLSVPTINSFYKLLSENDFANLKEYINLKYHFREKEKGNIKEKDNLRFLEDFILFCNPDRERWEKTRANMEKFNLKAGDRVADVGSGSGYYTFKFSDIVGETGKVYAIETNPLHLDYLNKYVADYNVQNVEVVKSSFDGIGLHPDIRVDVVYMCSLYHNVYAAFTDYERDRFVGSIRNALVDGGKLIIVDNDLVEGKDIPYHGPYINKLLITAQLAHYGFNLIDTYQFTPQRYALIFTKEEMPAKALPVSVPDQPNQLTITSAASRIRYRIIGTRTSGYTVRGKRIGKIMYQGLMENNMDLIREAKEKFEELWPQERIGDEYTAQIWFCRYLLSDEETRAGMLSDPLADYYFHYFADDDFARLKQYLLVKYDLERPEPENASIELNYDYEGDFSIDQLNEWNEFLIFNNPNRGAWEKTEEMMENLGLKPGMAVADIGCGGGFFSHQFSKLVGPKGQVYSTEINKDALKYLEDFIKVKDVKNIKPMVTRMNEAGLPNNSVDMIFMCSMYHAVYITDIEFVKDQFISTVKKALRPGGRLVIVDNDVTEPGVPSYYGPGIDPKLIIAQLHYYGFELEKRWQMIPQRFMLIFKLVDPAMGEPTTKQKFKSYFRKMGTYMKKKPPKREEEA